jgi:hypothetical protein
MPAADPLPADRNYVRRFLAHAVREAARQADLAVRFAEIIDEILGGARGEGQVGLTRGQWLKAAAYLRLREWEQSGVRARLVDRLPPADDVLRDLLRPPGAAERFDGEDLNRQVTRAAWTRLAWGPGLPDGADVVVEHQAPTARAAEGLAALLWRHRHLAGR